MPAPSGMTSRQGPRRQLLFVIIYLITELLCYQGYGFLFLTPKKPILLCSHILPEASKPADEVPIIVAGSSPPEASKGKEQA